MKKPLFSFLFLFLHYAAAFAQQSPKPPSREVFGTIVDSTGTVPAVNIKLTSATDSVTVTSNLKGVYDFPIVISKNFKITVTGIGYQPFTRRYVMDNGTKPIKLDPIKLKAQTNMLSTVTINAVIPIVIKEDTIEYKASAYKVREGSPVEDLLKKLPGVSVDANGNVTAHGKQVSKVRVDGKDYFTGDVQTATQNLPADIVETIQVIDDYGDQANLTGIKTGDPDKILNITIQKGKKKGQFGQGTIGAGNEGRYQAKLSANEFNNDQQISLLGTVNNNNTNAFNLSQAGGSGGRSGRSGGGGGSSGSGVSTANGITDNKSLGLNYRDAWGKKITVYGSYSFADKNTNTTSTSLQQDIFQSGSLINNDNTTDQNHSINHRFDFNLEYKIDTLNYLKFNPNFSYGTSNDNNSDIFSNMRNGVTVNGTEYSLTNSSAPSGGTSILYNHKFKKKGRNFSINAGYSYTKHDQDFNDKYTTVQDSIVNPLYQQINTNSNSDKFNIHLSYLEPIGKTTYLEANYTYSYTNTDNNRHNYRIDPKTGVQTYVDSLSTLYNYQFITNRFGFNLRGIKTKYNYTVGISAQPATLTGESQNFRTSTNTFNLVPTARFVYNFQKNHSLTINYSGNSSQPSFAQLQIQPDYSNPQNVVYGNPDLKPSFSNSINLRYNQFDIASGNSLFTNLSFNTIEDQIVANTAPVVSNTATSGTGGTVSTSTKQETHYLNTNGYYSMNGNYAFSKPFDNRKFTATLNGGASYNNNISYIEDQRNLGKNWVLNQGAKLRVDIDSVMDTEVSGNYSINNTKYSLPSSINTNAKTWTIGLDGRNYFFYNWILGYNLTQTINQGFSSTVKANPTLLSSYVEYQFLKKNIASFRFQAFDLFNENTGVSRTVSGNQIIDARTNRLGRYFMLTFTLRLQKFAGAQPKGGRGGGGRRGGDFGGGGGRRGNG
ncbi:TonB-dependent receptor domain-containing protein [Mucilaginibacter sp. OK098]|uniref:TonB-dependent receptor domain-containing protein n=1 Tax=Mucilaginibacter sp. OK098 TaxID=1855297 RepID=UPI0009191A17|nr:TonB-dependent receptor [Mucilaginibacter sp. OK098]SHN28254.1 Outer membrane receptor proteins, mostly Fe transport [Mucilaginibacter sp. OK098]